MTRFVGLIPFVVFQTFCLLALKASSLASSIPSSLASAAYHGLESDVHHFHSPSGRLQLSLQLRPEVELTAVDRSGTKIEVSGLNVAWADEIASHSFYPESASAQVGTRKTVVHVYGRNGASLEIHLFDTMMTYRFQLSAQNSFRIADETAEIKIPQQTRIRAQSVECGLEPDCFHSPSEGVFDVRTRIPSSHIVIPPAVIETTEGSLQIGEMNLRDHAGLHLRPLANGGFQFEFPKAPKRTELNMRAGFFIEDVVEREAYLAHHPAGTHVFPWRFVRWLKSDADLLNRSLLEHLASPADLTDAPTMDFSWVKRGFATDEWITDSTIDFPEEDLGFKSGVNTATYKYYIDFAKRFGLKYIILDAGWSDLNDIYAINPEMDLASIHSHAAKNSIGLIYWAQMNALKGNLEQKLDYLKGLGAIALKVDFVERNDIAMTRTLEKLYRETAKRQLMLIMHGIPVPAGQTWTYPHILSFEAGRGHEYNKFSSSVTPKHKLDLVLMRNPIGDFDYEGANFRNEWPEDFQPFSPNPRSMGTRASELSLYVFLDSKVHVMAGNLADYIRSPDHTNFLTSIPLKWDAVVPIGASFGRHALVAKRSGSVWYLAGLSAEGTDRFGSNALTVRAQRFLKPGSYRFETFEDCQAEGATASCAEMRTFVVEVTRETILAVPMSRSGGYIARIEPL